MKTIKPNTLLPKGAKLIPAKELTVGERIPLFYDAKLTYLGVVWFRLRGGYGASGDNEAWVADLPLLGASVEDYSFREPRWGLYHYDSLQEAMKAELGRALARALEKDKEAREIISALRPVIDLLAQATK